MKIQPKTDQELAALDLLPEGNYNFEVINAEDALSKSGNEMIKLNLKIWDNQGKIKFIFDYLLEAMAKKLKHFARHNGLIGKYEAGQIIAADCVGKCGTLILGVQEDKTGNYGPRNTVTDYIEKQQMETVTVKDTFNDDIPF